MGFNLLLCGIDMSVALAGKICQTQISTMESVHLAENGLGRLRHITEGNGAAKGSRRCTQSKGKGTHVWLPDVHLPADYRGLGAAVPWAASPGSSTSKPADP